MTTPIAVMVTGATGFIGRELTAQLLRAGHAVVCPIRTVDARSRQLEAMGARVELVRLDKRHEVHELAASSGVELVYHLAADGVGTARRNAPDMFHENVRMMRAVLEGGVDTNVHRVVYTGSCSQYAPGVPGVGIAEDHPQRPSCVYGASKAAAEMLGRVIARRSGIDFVTLRVFGVFGPGEASDRLVPHLISKLGRGESVELTPGEQSRDWTFVSDVVDALALAGSAQGMGSEATLNLCSGRQMSVRELASLVAEVMGADASHLRFGARPYRAHEPMWTVGDPIRISEALGWRPQVSLRQGIEAMRLAAGEGA